jgi:hypothetical protein
MDPAKIRFAILFYIVRYLKDKTLFMTQRSTYLLLSFLAKPASLLYPPLLLSRSLLLLFFFFLGHPASLHSLPRLLSEDLQLLRGREEGVRQGIAGRDAQPMVQAKHPQQKIGELLPVSLHNDTSRSPLKEVWPHKCKKVTQLLFDKNFTVMHFSFGSQQVLNKPKEGPTYKCQY